MKDYNVILISMDACRADHLSCYGYHRKTTPNIDKLAKQGALFKNCYSQSSYTLASHACMLTSLYPSVHGANFTYSRSLKNSIPTIPGILKTKGYKTVAWVGGPQLDPHWNLSKDFDYYFTKSNLLSKNIIYSLEWVKEHKKDKFFLFIHGMDTHYPFYPIGKFAKKNSKLVNKKDMILKNIKSEFNILDHKVINKRKQKFLIDLYDDAISHVDKYIGQLIKTLKKMQLYDKTIIIVTSDHGEELGERGYFFKHGDSLYQELIHIPLILKVPNFKTVTTEAKVRTIDYMPTILDLLNINNNTIMQGTSLKNYLMGLTDKDLPVFAELNYPWWHMYSMISGFRKIIIIIKKNKIFQQETFNIVVNPKEINEKNSNKLSSRILNRILRRFHENHELSEEEAHVGKMVLSQIKENKALSKELGKAESKKINVELKKRLEELGY